VVAFKKVKKMAFIKNRETQIKMANESLKYVDDIVPGDWIVDRDNFPTNVRGVQNYVHHSDFPCIRINDELTVTSDQVFVGQDGYFYLIDGLNNKRFHRYNEGIQTFDTYRDLISTRPIASLPEHLIKPLVVGTILEGENESIEVESIETVYPLTKFPPSKSLMKEIYSKDKSQIDIESLDINDYIGHDVKVVRLAIHRTGTMIVNGYKCLGIPCNEWNYETNSFEEPDSFEIIVDVLTGKYVKERS
jgi:hypothetical protein